MRHDENELLCRVGPGTPMGQLFPRYWTPIADATQLCERDSDPLRVRFCGEDAAVALSMGPILDRTREHLVPADAAIVHLHRLLLDAARRMAAGEAIPSLPSLATVTAVPDTALAPGARWQDLAPGHVAAGGPRIAAE